MRMPFLAGGALKVTARNSSGASIGELKSSLSRSLATLKPVKPPVPPKNAEVRGNTSDVDNVEMYEKPLEVCKERGGCDS